MRILREPVSEPVELVVQLDDIADDDQRRRCETGALLYDIG